MGRLRGGKPKFEEKYTKIKTMEVPALATTNKIESPGALYGCSNAAIILHIRKSSMRQPGSGNKETILLRNPTRYIKLSWRMTVRQTEE